MQKGLSLEPSKARLYQTDVAVLDSNNCVLFNSGGWVTQSTCKAINTWLKTYFPNHCIRVRIMKRVFTVELTALDGTVEHYNSGTQLRDTILIDLNYVRHT